MRIIAAAIALFLMIGLASACGGGGFEEEGEMRSALEDFTAALNAGNYEEAFGTLSDQCRQGLSVEKFAATWSDILSPEGHGTGRLKLTDLDVISRQDGMYTVKTAFELTRDGTTTTWGTEDDPYVESMVRENGEWHIHDRVCELFPLLSESPTPEE